MPQLKKKNKGNTVYYMQDTVLRDAGETPQTKNRKAPGFDKQINQ